MPAASQPNLDDDVIALRSEVARLRTIIGADEARYVELRHELLTTRDLLIGLEAELGLHRGNALRLERELTIRDRLPLSTPVEINDDATAFRRVRRAIQSRNG